MNKHFILNSDTLIEEETITENAIDLDLELDREKTIVVYNDDINTFDHVIRCFMKYCGHTIEQAENCAIEIHTKGSSIVKEGSFDELRPIRNLLSHNGLSAEIEDAK